MSKTLKQILAENLYEIEGGNIVIKPALEIEIDQDDIQKIKAELAPNKPNESDTIELVEVDKIEITPSQLNNLLQSPANRPQKEITSYQKLFQQRAISILQNGIDLADAKVDLTQNSVSFSFEGRDEDVHDSITWVLAQLKTSKYKGLFTFDKEVLHFDLKKLAIAEKVLPGITNTVALQEKASAVIMAIFSDPDKWSDLGSKTGFAVSFTNKTQLIEFVNAANALGIKIDAPKDKNTLQLSIRNSQFKALNSTIGLEPDVNLLHNTFAAKYLINSINDTEDVTFINNKIQVALQPDSNASKLVRFLKSEFNIDSTKENNNTISLSVRDFNALISLCSNANSRFGEKYPVLQTSLDNLATSKNNLCQTKINVLKNELFKEADNSIKESAQSRITLTTHKGKEQILITLDKSTASELRSLFDIDKSSANNSTLRLNQADFTKLFPHVNFIELATSLRMEAQDLVSSVMQNNLHDLGHNKGFVLQATKEIVDGAEVEITFEPDQVIAAMQVLGVKDLHKSSNNANQIRISNAQFDNINHQLKNNADAAIRHNLLAQDYLEKNINDKTAIEFINGKFEVALQADTDAEILAKYLKDEFGLKSITQSADATKLSLNAKDLNTLAGLAKNSRFENKYSALRTLCNNLTEEKDRCAYTVANSILSTENLIDLGNNKGFILQSDQLSSFISAMRVLGMNDLKASFTHSNRMVISPAQYQQIAEKLNRINNVAERNNLQHMHNTSAQNRLVRSIDPSTIGIEQNGNIQIVLNDSINAKSFAKYLKEEFHLSSASAHNNKGIHLSATDFDQLVAIKDVAAFTGDEYEALHNLCDALNASATPKREALKEQTETEAARVAAEKEQAINTIKQVFTNANLRDLGRKKGFILQSEQIPDFIKASQVLGINDLQVSAKKNQIIITNSQYTQLNRFVGRPNLEMAHNISAQNRLIASIKPSSLDISKKGDVRVGIRSDINKNNFVIYLKDEFGLKSAFVHDDKNDNYIYLSRADFEKLKTLNTDPRFENIAHEALDTLCNDLNTTSVTENKRITDAKEEDIVFAKNEFIFDNFSDVGLKKGIIFQSRDLDRFIRVMNELGIKGFKKISSNQIQLSNSHVKAINNALEKNIIITVTHNFLAENYLTESIDVGGALEVINNKIEIQLKAGTNSDKLATYLHDEFGLTSATSNVDKKKISLTVKDFDSLTKLAESSHFNKTYSKLTDLCNKLSLQKQAHDKTLAGKTDKAAFAALDFTDVAYDYDTEKVLIAIKGNANTLKEKLIQNDIKKPDLITLHGVKYLRVAFDDIDKLTFIPDLLKTNLKDARYAQPVSENQPDDPVIAKAKQVLLATFDWEKSEIANGKITIPLNDASEDKDNIKKALQTLSRKQLNVFTFDEANNSLQVNIRDLKQVEKSLPIAAKKIKLASAKILSNILENNYYSNGLDKGFTLILSPAHNTKNFADILNILGLKTNLTVPPDAKEIKLTNTQYTKLCDHLTKLDQRERATAKEAHDSRAVNALVKAIDPASVSLSSSGEISFTLSTDPAANEATKDNAAKNFHDFLVKELKLSHVRIRKSHDARVYVVTLSHTDYAKLSTLNKNPRFKTHQYLALNTLCAKLADSLKEKLVNLQNTIHNDIFNAAHEILPAARDIISFIEQDNNEYITLSFQTPQDANAIRAHLNINDGKTGESTLYLNQENFNKLFPALDFARTKVSINNPSERVDAAGASARIGEEDEVVEGDNEAPTVLRSDRQAPQPPVNTDGSSVTFRADDTAQQATKTRLDNWVRDATRGERSYKPTPQTGNPLVYEVTVKKASNINKFTYNGLNNSATVKNENCKPEIYSDILTLINPKGVVEITANGNALKIEQLVAAFNAAVGKGFIPCITKDSKFSQQDIYKELEKNYKDDHIIFDELKKKCLANADLLEPWQKNLIQKAEAIPAKNVQRPPTEEESAEIEEENSDIIYDKCKIANVTGLSINTLHTGEKVKQFAEAKKIKPENAVYVFPGNVSTPHVCNGDYETYLLAPKTGGGLAKVADELGKLSSPIRTLSLPTIGGASPELIGDNLSQLKALMYAAGRGYDIIVPTRPPEGKYGDLSLKEVGVYDLEKTDSNGKPDSVVSCNELAFFGDNHSAPSDIEKKWSQDYAKLIDKIEKLAVAWQRTNQSLSIDLINAGHKQSLDEITTEASNIIGDPNAAKQLRTAFEEGLRAQKAAARPAASVRRAPALGGSNP